MTGNEESPPIEDDPTAGVYIKATVSGAATNIQAGGDADVVVHEGPHVVVHGEAVHSTIIVGDYATVTAGPVPFTLSPLDGVRVVPARAGPAALLDPAYELVPFIDTAERSALDHWISDPEPRRACLVSAPGGYGKTRLAMQVCRNAEQAGWCVVIATNSSDIAALEERDRIQPAATATAPTLVLLDYADRWSRNDLQALISAISGFGGRVRLLMTARSEAFWQIAARNLRSLGFHPDRIRIPDLTERPDDAAAHYRAALDGYGCVLSSARASADTAAAPLPAAAYHILEIHVRALLVRLGDGPHQHPIGPTWRDLSKELIERELDHWARMAQDPLVPIRSPLDAIYRATLFATLMRGLAYDTAYSLLGRLGFVNIEELIADHGKLYPAPVRTTVMWPMLPDRIGEDLLATAMTGAPEGSYMDGWGGPGCDRLVMNLFAITNDIEIPGKDPVPLVDGNLWSAVAVLADTAERWPHVREVLDHIVTANPQLGILTSGPVMEKIAGYLPLNTLRRLAAAVNDFTLTSMGALNLALQSSWIAVAAAIRDHEQFDDIPVDERIRVLDNIANILMYSGRLDEAVSHSRRMMRLVLDHWVSIDFDAVLAGEDTNAVLLQPGADAAPTARAISHHANRLSARDETEEAFAWSTISAKVAEALAESDPTHLVVVNTYATALDDAGLADEAIELERRMLAATLRRYRDLDDTDPSTRSVLASTMNNLGTRLVDKGQYDQGIELLGQAVFIRASLNEEFPWLFGPEIAESLHNLAIARYKSGNLDYALRCIKEAVAIRRRMATAVPQSFARLLLRSLRILGMVHLSNGDGSLTLDTSEDYLNEWRKGIRQLGSQAISTLVDGLQLHLAGLVATDRGDEFISAVESMLTATQGGAGTSVHVRGSLVFELAARTMQAHQSITVNLIQHFAHDLERMPATSVDADTAFLLAFGATIEGAFDAAALALRLLSLTCRSPGEEEWGKELQPQYLESLPQLLNQWAGLRQDGPRSAIVVAVVAELLPLVRSAAATTARARDFAGRVTHLSAAVGIQLHQSTAIVDLAAMAVECFQELATADPKTAANLVTALHTLAVAYLQIDEPDTARALDNAEASVALALKRRDDRPSASNDSDFAMCLETYARALAQAGDTAIGEQTLRLAFTVRLSVAVAVGRRALPTLLMACQINESLLQTMDLSEQIPLMWAATKDRLPPALWDELQQLRIHEQSNDM